MQQSADQIGASTPEKCVSPQSSEIISEEAKVPVPNGPKVVKSINPTILKDDVCHDGKMGLPFKISPTAMF